MTAFEWMASLVTLSLVTGAPHRFGDQFQGPDIGPLADQGLSLGATDEGAPEKREASRWM